MRALDLDFIAARRRTSLVGLSLFAAGAVCAALVLVEAQVAREEAEAATEARAQAERRLRAARGGAAPAAAPAPETARAMRDANAVIARLLTPWPRLLADTAQAAGTAIALTGLNPDAQAGSVRLAGVAPDLAAVHAFITRLQAVPGFAQVHLLQHDAAREGGAPARVAFVVSARWGEAR